MDTNKIREQFESAWRARYPKHPAAALKRSGLDPESYCNTRTMDAWWAWQASREAVAVDLPDRDVEQCAYSLGFNSCLKQSRAAIEAKGLKVAP